MKSHIVIDGNAFYEVDDECMQKKEEQKKRQRERYSEKTVCRCQNNCRHGRTPGL